MSQSLAQALEERRIFALLQLGILDTPPELAYDDILEAAATFMKAPMAAISLVDSERQWFKARIGLNVTQTPRDHSFCVYTIQSAEPLIVADSWADPRFAGNPLVLGSPLIRSYIGLPLVTDEGLQVGALCVLDHLPRHPTQHQIAYLGNLAKQAVLLMQWNAHARSMSDLKRRITNLEETVTNQHSQMQTVSRMSELGEMAATIAHELNNPLAVVLGRSQQLLAAAKSGVIDAERLTTATQAIEAMCKRMAKIISSLRGYARDDANDPPGQVSVGQFLTETLELCGSRFYHAGIRLDVATVSPALMMLARPVSLSQVLLNLLNNAADAIKDCADRWIRVGVEVTPVGIEYTVTDSGPEIPVAIRERIMQPFFTTKAAGVGSGIGLHLSRKIIESHGGRLSLLEGAAHTTFKFTVPMT